MQTIPLLAIPAQSFQIILGGQNCLIALYQRGDHLYSDLFVDQTAIWRGVICQTMVDLKPYPYLPFKGALFFVDMEGAEDPRPEGLGNRRWPLLYVDPAEELPAGLQKQGAPLP